MIYSKIQIRFSSFRSDLEVALSEVLIITSASTCDLFQRSGPTNRNSLETLQFDNCSSRKCP